MKITILGAAGNAGSRLVAEAQSRGHEVTAVVRNESAINNLPTGINIITGDAANVADVVRVSTSQDVVISAIRPESGRESDMISTTQSLMDGLAQTGVRLLVVGGAATLTVPGTDGKTVLEDSNYLPIFARHIGKASAEQFEVCLAETRVDWAYLSPAADFAPGQRTGNFRLGSDELLVDAEGVSKISMEDAAVVLINEAERPSHQRTRFTAAY
ncbi:MAG: putative NADH-flavin reductase [Candidatus Azotimanducaceae bacterium]|jgi:putative NADH-flavin reductase